jgi:hypothetical protein
MGGVVILAHQRKTLRTPRLKTQDLRLKTQDRERTPLLFLRLASCILGLSIVFAVVLCFPSWGQSEKVAVLYFTDHSGFGSGCGCLSFWPLNVIFGTGQSREEWNLRSGFRDLLNEKLSEAGYIIVEPGYADKALQEMGKGDLAALADKLGADVMVAGDIRKFEQHHSRASSQGPTVLSPGESMTMVTMGGIGGFFYSASVKADVTIYDSSGEELERAEISSKKDLRDFYMGLVSVTYHRGDTKEKTDAPGHEPPIVDPKKLDTMKFGTDEFKNRTLFGMATMDVMGKIVAKVEEHLKPPVLPPVQGKIIYVGTGKRLKENEVYINLGAGDGLRPRHRLGVYVEALQLTDPDTGKELDTLPEKKVGVIKVSKIEADHLSIAEIVEKTGQIERGNIVKRE